VNNFSQKGYGPLTKYSDGIDILLFPNLQDVVPLHLAHTLLPARSYANADIDRG